MSTLFQTSLGNAKLVLCRVLNGLIANLIEHRLFKVFKKRSLDNRKRLIIAKRNLSINIDSRVANIFQAVSLSQVLYKILNN